MRGIGAPVRRSAGSALAGAVLIAAAACGGGGGGGSGGGDDDATPTPADGATAIEQGKTADVGPYKVQLMTTASVERSATVGLTAASGTTPETVIMRVGFPHGVPEGTLELMSVVDAFPGERTASIRIKFNAK